MLCSHDALQAQAAHQHFAQMMWWGTSPSAMLDLVHAEHFEWSVSDGNLGQLKTIAN